LEPKGANVVFDICYQFQLGAKEIDSLLLSKNPSLYDFYLRYLMSREKLNDIYYIWENVSHEYVGEETKIGICNLFMQKNQFDFVKTVWNSVYPYGAHSDLIQNADFEYAFNNECIGWRVGRADGVTVSLDYNEKYSGERAVGVQFDGEHNPRIAVLRQVVPAEMGRKYLFSSFVKTEGITSSNGILFEVKGYRCGGLHARSREFTGDNQWTEARIEFSVPEDCNAIIVSFMREKSNKFNNKINGKAWVDKANLMKLTI
jgi:hypothetical protein